ncbi:MAG: hypothetical protein KH268_07525 [Clostridiales bacterium]|uniref:Uncharacterized protein n=1 Tax=Candidatus Anaerobutyricum stercoripullorum TaxID=2838456 RepID=A0A9D2BDU9_9FIRM|nr:hypothetical protein [Clostridiales bacterium]HIX71862.1 hypothetical protein [Candidatus Anaerobutyricum stercoripullorum]
MKIRSDFVTNSSSSSFILARKDELTEEQKQLILDYVCDNLLGEMVLTPDSTEEEIAGFIEEEYIEEERARQIRKALKEGKSIYYGCVSFEDCEYSYSDAFETLWADLEKCTPDNFTMIDGDLSY